MAEDNWETWQKQNLLAKLEGSGNARTLCTHGQFHEY